MFSVCPHLWGGGGVPRSGPAGWVPQPGPAGGWVLYPTQWIPQPEGYLGTPRVRSGWGDTKGSPPGQVRMCILQPGDYPGYPPARSGRGGGTQAGAVPGVPPWPGQDGGYPSWGVRTGVPPRTVQHMEYLIRHGRYASCIHTGGLSCFLEISNVYYS